MASMLARFLNRWRHPEGDARQLTEYSPAPGTAIRYSPTLVAELTAEHREFFALHDALVTALRLGRVEDIPVLLRTFDDLLTTHLLTEQVRLYAYMDAYFSADAHTRGMLREYRTEMERIGQSVRQMVKKYRLLATDRSLLQNIEQDMAELRQVLEERMSREERTLYPLYMPVASPAGVFSKTA